MRGLFKDKKKVLILIFAVLMALTLGIGIFAALTLKDRPTGGIISKPSSSSNASTSDGDGSSSDGSSDDTTDSSTNSSSEGDGTSSGGDGVAPPETDFLEPPVADPVYFNRPSSMKAVYVLAGVDYLKGATDEATVTGEIDKALESAKSMDMNSIVFDTKLGDKAVYLTSTFQTAGIDFDALDYGLKKAKEMGFYTYVIYDALDVAGESGAIKPTEIASDTMNKIIYNMKQIAGTYTVDGIILDNYYNDDSEESYNNYIKHGGGIGYENYMQDVSRMVFQNLAYTIRRTAPTIQVGMATAPVWENYATNQQGSETSAIYTALGTGNSNNIEYVQEGLADFVAVKASGATTDKNIPFKNVATWWAEIINDYDAPVYIVHSADKIATDNPGWSEYDQLIKQVIEMENIVGLDGSMFNSLKRLQEDPKSSTTNLLKYYKKEINPKHVLTELAVTKPSKLTYTTFEQTVTFAGASDPITEVTINGEKISTDTNGYFTINKPLSPGPNKFTIVHKGKSVTYNITREVEIIKEISPTGALTVDGSMQITISATAYADAQVYATVGGQTISMSIVEYENDQADKNSSYKRFEGVYTAPDATNSVQNIGNVVVYGSWQGISKSKEGASIKVNKRPVMGDGKPVQVISDQAETFPTNIINDYSNPNYFPLPKGSIDYTIGEEIVYRNGAKTYSYYNLNSNLRVYTKDIQAISESSGVYNNKINGMSVKADASYTYVTLATQQKVSYRATYDGSNFSINFNYTNAVPDSMKLSKNPLFASANWSGSTLKLVLRKSGVFMGYRAYYDSQGNLVLRFNNPPGSLSGARIVVDPGHGGIDPGASGFLPAYPESVINGMIAEKLTEKLKASGASVLMLSQTPELDEGASKVQLSTRVLQARNFNPHVYLSVHCNSALNSSATGAEAYYFNAYSKNLAAYNSTKISDAMGNTNRGGKFGYMYVTRDPQFASTLVEIGFMSNEKEYKKLINDEYQDAVASAIVSGTSSFLKSVGASDLTGTESVGSVTSGTAPNSSSQSSSSQVSSSSSSQSSSSSKPSSSSSKPSSGKYVQSVELSQTRAALKRGATVRLYAEVLPETADNKDVFWVSDNTSVATVSTSGLVKAIANGTAKISAISDDGGFEGVCTIVVSDDGKDNGNKYVTGITLSEKSISIDIDDEYLIDHTIKPSNATDTRVDWTTSNQDVAMVTTDGVVIGIGKGTATITAKTKDGSYKATCSVTVSGNQGGSTAGMPDSIEFNTNMLELAIGKSDTLEVYFDPDDVSNKQVTWRSSDKGVATVDNNGVVKGISEGESTITAVSKVGGKRATCKVYVSKSGGGGGSASTPGTAEDDGKPRSLDLDETELHLTMGGGSTTLYADLQPSRLSRSNLIWEVNVISGNGVVWIDKKSGDTVKVVPTSKGEAYITVYHKFFPDYTQDCYVVVE